MGDVMMIREVATPATFEARVLSSSSSLMLLAVIESPFPVHSATFPAVASAHVTLFPSPSAVCTRSVIIALVSISVLGGADAMVRTVDSTATSYSGPGLDLLQEHLVI